MLRFVRKRARAEREFVCRQFLLVSFRRIKNRTHNKSLRIHTWRGGFKKGLLTGKLKAFFDDRSKVPDQLVSSTKSAFASPYFTRMCCFGCDAYERGSAEVRLMAGGSVE